MILGKNLIIALDGVAIAAAKSCSFGVSQEFLKACSPTSGRTKNKIPTTYDWNMSVGGLISNSDNTVSLTDKLIAGTRCLLTFTDGDGQLRAGFAYVKSCDEDGSVGGLATYKASFESDGPLYKYIAYNNGEYPQDGIGFELSISQNSIYYAYDGQDQDRQPYVVQIDPSQAGKVYIFTNQVWAWYENYASSDIKGWMSNDDTQRLEENATSWGNSNAVVELDVNAQYGTLVSNTKPIILFLYE